MKGHFEFDFVGQAVFRQVEMTAWVSGWKDYVGKVKRQKILGYAWRMVRDDVNLELLF